jgi:hypothetical protein
MRVVEAAALTVAALLLASMGSAQGIGAAAAREREKRNSAAGKPTKVFTDNDLGGGGSIAAPAPSTTDETAAGAAAGEAGAAKDSAKTAPSEEEQRAQAQAAWRKKLEQARKEEQVYKDVVDSVQAELNDPAGSFYGPGRAARIAFLEENKTKLSEAQTRIAALEEEGRRNGYR